MATLNEEAMAYEPQSTRNISELDTVSTNLQVIEKSYVDSDGVPFKIKVITVNGEDYRVPVTVLKNLKAILEQKPTLKTFKVTRTGEGKKTTYTVIPME